MNRSQLMHLVLSGLANKKEIDELNNWIAQSHENQDEFDDFKLLWQSVAQTEKPLNHFYEGRQRIQEKMNRKHNHRHRRRTLIQLIIFSCLLLIMSIGLIIYWNKVNQKQFHYVKFDNSSLEEIINVLERDYNIQIEVQQKRMLSCKFTGAFYQMDPVEGIMQSLKQAMKLDLEIINRNRFLLKGSNCFLDN